MAKRGNRFAAGTPLTLRNDLKGIIDIYTRDAIQEIHDFLHSHDILRGVFRKVSFNAPAAGTFVVDHGLPFVPCEVILTSALGGNNVTVNYDSITDETFEITTTAAGQIKFLAGNITDFDVTR